MRACRGVLMGNVCIWITWIYVVSSVWKTNFAERFCLQREGGGDLIADCFDQDRGTFLLICQIRYHKSS